MQLGMIGLGRMGANMVRRLINNGHNCVVFDRSPQAVSDLVKDKATGSASLSEFVKNVSQRLVSEASKLALKHAQDVVLAHDQMLFVFELDLTARILAKENSVARFHVGRHQVAGLAHFPLAHRYDLSFLRFFLGGIRNDDSALGFVFFLDALHQDAIA